MSNEDIVATRAHLEQEFQVLAEAMKKAAAEENHYVVADEAVKFQMARRLKIVVGSAA